MTVAWSQRFRYFRQMVYPKRISLYCALVVMLQAMPVFSWGPLFPIYVDSHYGFIGNTGKTVIEPKFAYVDTFSEGQRKEYEKWYNAHYPAEKMTMVEDPVVEFKAPEKYNADIDHHMSFYNGIRESKPIREDALFGMRACGPALATNKSIFEKKIINWDPELAKAI